MRARHRPSALVRILMRVVVPKGDREFFLGDLEEAEARDRLKRSAGTNDHRDRSAVRELAGAIQLISRRRRSTIRPKKSRGDNMLHELKSDLRFGLRLMLRTPGFTIVALLTMALGIGANTAMFSVVNGVLLKPLPYPEADRLVFLMANNLPRGWDSFTISPLDFWDWQEMNRSTELMAAYRWTAATYTGGDRPASLFALNVSEDYFPMFGAEPALGRGFTAEDLDPNREAVVLLGHGLWQSSFGSDPAVVGRSMILDGVPSTIVGVVPESYRHIGGTKPDVILPLRPEQWWYNSRGSHFLRGLARMKPGVTLEQARADLSSVTASLEAQYPETNEGWGAVVTPLDEMILGGARPQLLMLLASVGLVLIVACANVAQMTLARASVRGQEMAIRTALGAGRARVVKQVLAESLLLSGCGGLIGMAVAFGLIKALVLGWPQMLPRMEEVNINGTVLLFTAGLSLASGCLFGLFPALSVAGSNIGETLRRASWSVTGDSSRRKFRAGLVVAEVGLAVVLLVGSGLLVRSLLALQGEDPGFEPANVLAFSTNLPAGRYPSDEEQRTYGDACLERLSAIPGVESAAITTLIPVTGQDEIWGLQIEGRPQNTLEDQISALTYRISPDYFDAMGIPVLSGRSFSRDDREGTVGVTVVSDAFVNQHFPGEGPLGKRFRFGGDGSPFWEIVGVVGDVQHYNLGTSSIPQIYLPFAQRPDDGVRFVIKSSVPPLSLVGAVRDEIEAVDPDQPLIGLTTMEQVIDGNISAPKFRTYLLSAFGLTALLLSVVGLYGVLSYAVAQRSREIGMRMALGARQSAIVKLILRDGVPLVLTGIVIGLLGAFGITRVLASMLFGVGVRDPGVFIGAPLLLMVVAAVAVLIPAIRATRVDPVKTLAVE